jgi:outer membrane receptor protein involved in Fe transport
LGGVLASFAASAERSSGWDPIEAGRGPANSDLFLRDVAASARFVRDMGAAVAALRLGVYQEDRGAGDVGAGSRARGAQASFAAEADPGPDTLGWRAQVWALASDLANTSVTVPANQSSSTLADNEYRTPALGLGANAELRKVWARATLQLGADARADGGEDRETFDNVNGVLTQMRRAGGETFVGGLYAEATDQAGPLLVAAGARMDDWRTFDGHDIESAATAPSQGVITRTPSRSGVMPSGRLAARWDVASDLWVRAAAYTGLRPPTLNELFRTYRVGNNVTEANAGLKPEKLYGVEGGVGGSARTVTWTLTAFYNRLDDPVTNVTLRDGPFSAPIVGFIPAGGALLQRQNVGAIDAWGLEAEGELRLTSALSLRAALDWTHARVDGGTAAPALDGLEPAETPSVVATAFIDWKPWRRWRAVTAVRHESRRWVDDQNRLPLGAATVADVRVEYAVSRLLTVFVAADNVLDVAVQQNESVLGLYSYGEPRLVSAGFRLTNR